MSHRAGRIRIPGGAWPLRGRHAIGADRAMACLAIAGVLPVEDVPGFPVPLPLEPPPWRLSDDALAEWFAAEDGYGTVAFKERDSLRLVETGFRAAVSRATIRAGLEALCDYGAEIRSYHRSIGGAAIRVDPTLAPELRRHPLVDYLEPRQQWPALDRNRNEFLQPTRPWAPE